MSCTDDIFYIQEGTWEIMIGGAAHDSVVSYLMYVNGGWLIKVGSEILYPSEADDWHFNSVSICFLPDPHHLTKWRMNEGAAQTVKLKKDSLT